MDGQKPEFRGWYSRPRLHSTINVSGAARLIFTFEDRGGSEHFLTYFTDTTEHHSVSKMKGGRIVHGSQRFTRFLLSLLEPEHIAIITAAKITKGDSNG